MLELLGTRWSRRRCVGSISGCVGGDRDALEAFGTFGDVLEALEA